MCDSETEHIPKLSRAILIWKVYTYEYSLYHMSPFSVFFSSVTCVKETSDVTAFKQLRGNVVATRAETVTLFTAHWTVPRRLHLQLNLEWLQTNVNNPLTLVFIINWRFRRVKNPDNEAAHISSRHVITC
jgi:hypothetical protein